MVADHPSEAGPVRMDARHLPLRRDVSSLDEVQVAIGTEDGATGADAGQLAWSRVVGTPDPDRTGPAFLDRDEHDLCAVGGDVVVRDARKVGKEPLVLSRLEVGDMELRL